MKKMFFVLALASSFILAFSGCNGNEEEPIPENTFMIGGNTFNVGTSSSVSYDNDNMIAITSEEVTSDANNGVCVVFDGDIRAGKYDLSAKNDGPKVYGLQNFNMSELPFLLEDDSIYIGEVYICISGSLVVTVTDSTYSVILTNSIATNNGVSFEIALNFEGTLNPYTISPDNYFYINDNYFQIGMAGNATLIGLSSMVFLSPNHKQAYIVTTLGSFEDGTYQLSNLSNYYNVIIATDFDIINHTWSTAYSATGGELSMTTNDDGSHIINISDAEFINLEHGWIIDGSLHYYGFMYGLPF